MLAAAVVLALLGGWEVYVQSGGIDSLVLPAPHQIAASLWDDRGYLLHNLVVTGEEVLLGIALAVGAGLLLAGAMHLSRAARRALYPLLMASQTLPIVVIAPLLVYWLGFDLRPKLAIIALVCFFPVVVSTLDGLASVDPDLLKLVRTLGASRRRAFVAVELRSALPGLLAGAKICVVTSLIAAVLAEQAGSSEGLGHVITYATGQLEASQAWAAVVLLSALAVTLFGVLELLQRRFAPWSVPSRRT